ncbi:A/G-specific adenine glycosylase [Aquabacterium sp.]|uniref:A/G-specific adenine glycosylase n=1 Tax=Aquabacterium sp. TaxID=1872578 RepID=UPI0035B4A243
MTVLQDDRAALSAGPEDALLARARDRKPVLSARLVAWQKQEGRHHLPWQQGREPYRVWLSEIMLQQTQVSTVMGYFQRFLQRFPDVHALAAAPLDDVLALWSGLGYYSRARNLHRCAQVVVTEHGGVFPGRADVLSTLPGIGPSTAAAIAAFCFSERVSIMDGNVRRVLSRVLGWGQDLSVKAHERSLSAAAEVVLPVHGGDMPSYTQGLMDLGATLCTLRKPACLTCPWSDLCVAREEGRPEVYPVKSRKLKRSQRDHIWLWLTRGDAVWLEQMPDKGVWAGLWTLPLIPDDAAMTELVGPSWSAQLERLPRIKHVLTHLDWWLTPVRLHVPEQGPSVQSLVERLHAVNLSGRWVPLADLSNWGLPAPLRRLLQG